VRKGKQYLGGGGSFDLFIYTRNFVTFWRNVVILGKSSNIISFSRHFILVHF
jgi:hypothetical protein